MDETLIDRILARVIVDLRSGCWNWQGSKNLKGYGHLKVNGHVVTAHRAMWRAHGKAEPEGLFLCHSCDNRACCNPAHLFTGTAADNNRDAIQKGRAVYPAKLSPDTVRSLRAEYAAGEAVKTLAAKHGVHSSTIYRALSGERWASVA